MRMSRRDQIDDIGPDGGKEGPRIREHGRGRQTEFLRARVCTGRVGVAQSDGFGANAARPGKKVRRADHAATEDSGA